MKIIITIFLTFFSLQVISQNPCNSSVTVTQNIIDSTVSSIKSNLSIIANNQVNNSVSYYSSNAIELNPGFNTAQKAVFKASVENCSQNIANNTWYKIANFPGVPRRDGVAFNIGNKGYFGCGRENIGIQKEFQDFWEYDIQNNIWTKKADVPVSFSSSYGFSINGKGYVMSGFGTNLSIYEYNPTNDSWTIKLNQIPELGRSTNFVWNNSAYIVPGAGGTSSSVYKFDPVANTFTPFAALPTIYDLTKVGSSKVSFVIDNKAYIGMGVDYENSFGVKTFHCLDLTNQTWTRISDFPFTYGLIGSTGFGINGKGIIIGGGIQGTVNKTFSVFYEY